MKKTLYIILLILLVTIYIYFVFGKNNNRSFGHLFLPITQSLQKNIPFIYQSNLPHFDHIVVILFENKPAKSIKNNPSAPYLNSLMKKYSYSDNYFAITNPSLPNYLSLIGGSTFNVTTDCMDCFISSPNLVDNLEEAHKTWKAYMESMPNPCFIGSKGDYAQKHNPFIYFDDIRNNKVRCNNIVPYSNLVNDLKAIKTTPDFIWISPNLCNDMHSCSIGQGDLWLSKEIPEILNSQSFTAQNSLLVITFDEGDLNNNKIITVFAGSHVKDNFVSETKYTHYSLLHTIEMIWSLPLLTENDANASLMKDLFK